MDMSTVPLRFDKLNDIFRAQTHLSALDNALKHVSLYQPQESTFHRLVL